MHGIRSLRTRTFELLQPGHASRSLGWYVNWSIILLIAINVLAVVLETVDWVYAAYEPYFFAVELVSVVVFTVEYVARIWSGIEAQSVADDHPIRGRVRVATQPMLIIDFLAIAPFYLTWLGVGVDLRFLRALRLLRLLRMLKLVRYSDTMKAFGIAFQRKRDELVVALTGNLILLLLASSLMYFAEHQAQPDAFGSIPEAMWWGIATLTTVGYGDVTPVTSTGQLLGGIVAVLGIGMFALPASILASGFMQEATNETITCPECGHAFNVEHDAEQNRVEYTPGERVRINLSIDVARSDPNLRQYHGLIGRVEESTAGQPGQYSVTILSESSSISPERTEADSNEQVTLSWRDLRRV